MGKVETLVLDCRQMEPPRPMIVVLEALEDLNGKGRVKMIHRMRPVHLLPILKTRGYDWEFLVEQEDYIELLIQPKDVRRS